MNILKIRRESGKIFCPLTDSCHIETPEEKVRQEYIKILVEDYGYSLDQMAQEIKVNNSQRGQGKARADIVVWKSKQDKIESKANNQRFRLYKYVAEHLFGDSIFQDYEFPEVSSYLIVNRNSCQDVEQKKNEIKERLFNLYDIDI